MKVNKNVIGFSIFTVIIIILSILFFVTYNKGTDKKVTDKRIEELTIEVYKLAKPETESVIGFKKRLNELSENFNSEDVKRAKKFIKEKALTFTETLDDCDECIVSVEIDEINVIDNNTYDIYIRLINTFEDSVKAEIPVRLVAGYHPDGIRISVENYIKKKTLLSNCNICYNEYYLL